MQNVFEHFEQMKLGLQSNAQRVLAYHFKKFLKRKRQKEMEKAKKKAPSNTGKAGKSKGGYKKMASTVKPVALSS